MYTASTFVRRAIAHAFGVAKGPGTNPIAYAAKRWGERSEVVASMQRAAVPSAGTSTGDPMAEHVQSADSIAFIELLQRVTAFDRTTGIQRMSARASFVPSGVPPRGYWVGESKAIPMTAMTTTRGRLVERKVATAIVVPDELVADESIESEMFIRARMLEAVTHAVDSAYLDLTNAGSASTPASVLNDAPTFASSGDVADDVATLIANFTGSLARAVFYTHPRLAAQIGLRVPNGIGAACGALGGQLAGLPLYVSEASPFDSDGASLALVDAGAVAAVDQGISVNSTKQALVELDTAPQGASDTPTAASATLVSLFQSDLVAFKLVRRLSWQRVSETAAVVITGADYSGT